jgi:hypothetical protein
MSAKGQKETSHQTDHALKSAGLEVTNGVVLHTRAGDVACLTSGRNMRVVSHLAPARAPRSLAGGHQKRSRCT